MWCGAEILMTNKHAALTALRTGGNRDCGISCNICHLVWCGYSPLSHIIRKAHSSFTGIFFHIPSVIREIFLLMAHIMASEQSA